MRTGYYICCWGWRTYEDWMLGSECAVVGEDGDKDEAKNENHDE